MRRGQRIVPEVRDELRGLVQPIKGEQMGRASDTLERGQGSVVGTTHGDGGMCTIGEADHEIWINATPDAKDLDTLTAERMMRMRDGYESQWRLELKGSVLCVFRPFGTARCKPW